MVNFKRWLIHAFMPPWCWRRSFPASTLKAIEIAVRESERLHSGELRFAVENALTPIQVWRGVSAGQRAVEVFSDLRVWDTEENSGVLIYVLLADREVHIVADRGIARRVAQADWDAIAKAMRERFKQGDFKQGALEGIGRITSLLAGHFPPGKENPNELPDRPVIIGR